MVITAQEVKEAYESRIWDKFARVKLCAESVDLNEESDRKKLNILREIAKTARWEQFKEKDLQKLMGDIEHLSNVRTNSAKVHSIAPAESDNTLEATGDQIISNEQAARTPEPGSAPVHQESALVRAAREEFASCLISAEGARMRNQRIKLLRQIQELGGNGSEFNVESTVRALTEFEEMEAAIESTGVMTTPEIMKRHKRQRPLVARYISELEEWNKIVAQQVAVAKPAA